MASATFGVSTIVAPMGQSAFAPTPASMTGSAVVLRGGSAAIEPSAFAPELVSPTASLLRVGGISAVGSGILGAMAVAGSRSRRSRAAITRRVSSEQWNEQVRRIEGNRAVFDVTIPKPLGLVPRDFPNRSGVGVASIKPEGNTAKLNEDVLVNEKPGMFVLEGDEVVAVNGLSVEGKPLSEVGPLVKSAEGDSITLTLCRYTLKGPVKVVFLPEGSMVTMRRGTEIQQAGKNCDAPIAYSCNEGWCKACWMTLDAFPDSVYKACNVSKSAQRPAPPHPRLVPEDWDSALPFSLVSWAESMKRRRKAKKAQEAAMQAENTKQEDPDQMAMA